MTINLTGNRHESCKSSQKETFDTSLPLQEIDRGKEIDPLYQREQFPLSSCIEASTVKPLTRTQQPYEQEDSAPTVKSSPSNSPRTPLPREYIVRFFWHVSPISKMLQNGLDHNNACHAKSLPSCGKHFTDPCLQGGILF